MDIFFVELFFVKKETFRNAVKKIKNQAKKENRCFIKENFSNYKENFYKNKIIVWLNARTHIFQRLFWTSIMIAGLLIFFCSILYILLQIICQDAFYELKFISPLVKNYSEILNTPFFKALKINSFSNVLSTVSYLNVILSTITLAFGKQTYGIVTEYMIKEKYGKIFNAYFYVCFFSIFILIYANSANKNFLSFCQIAIQFIGTFIYVDILRCFMSSFKSAEKRVDYYIKAKIWKATKTFLGKTKKRIEINNIHDLFVTTENISSFLSQSIPKGEAKDWGVLVSTIKSILQSTEIIDNYDVEKIINSLYSVWYRTFKKISNDEEYFIKESSHLFVELYSEFFDKTSTTQDTTKTNTQIVSIFTSFALFIVKHIKFETFRIWYSINKNTLKNKNSINMFTHLVLYGYFCTHVCLLEIQQKQALEYDFYTFSSLVSNWMDKSIPHPKKEDELYNKSMRLIVDNICSSYSITTNHYTIAEYKFLIDKASRNNRKKKIVYSPEERITYMEKIRIVYDSNF